MKKNSGVLGLIKYKELLINKESSIKKKSKLIEPLKQYLKKRSSDIDNYIECCDLINTEYININKFRKDQFQILYKYDITIALISIISKVENYNHKIIRDNENVENQFHILHKRKNCINMYQSNIEGLGMLIKDILNNSYKFKRNVKYKTKDDYRKSLNRCSKKTFKISKLIIYLNSLVNIEELTIKIKNNDFKLIKEEKRICLEYSNIDEYKKREIASIRCYIHDYNDKLVYEKEFLENDKLSEKLKELNIDKVDFEKLIIYDEENNHFSIKYDMISTEFISILVEVHKEFMFQLKEMSSNSFINSEIDNLIITKEGRMNITYREAIDFYFVIKAISLVYYKAVICYWNRFHKEPYIPFLGSDIKTLNNIINQLYTLLWQKELPQYKFKQLIEIYTFSQNEIYDMYYKPIINIKDRIIIIPSIMEGNNFNRTFLNHMHQIGAKIKEGYLFEKYLKNIFKERGFKVYDKDKPKLNFDLGNGRKGDIDLLAIKGKKQGKSDRRV